MLKELLLELKQKLILVKKARNVIVVVVLQEDAHITGQINLAVNVL